MSRNVGVAGATMGRCARHIVLMFCFAAASFSPNAAEANEPLADVLFVPAPSLPTALRRTVPRVLTRGARLVPRGPYIRAAQDRGLAPANGRAIRELATLQNAQVIVVAGSGGWGRRRMLRLRYYDGRTGAVLRFRTHRLRGRHISASAQRVMVADLRLAASEASDEGPSASALEPDARGEAPALEGQSRGDEEADREVPDDAAQNAVEGESPNVADAPAAWGFDLGAGLGFGQRGSTVPTAAGEGRYSSSPFPAIYIAFDLWLRPIDDPAFRVGLGTHYYSSMGLSAEELRDDGSTATVDSHAHSLSVGLSADYEFTVGPRVLRAEVELGWFFRMLDSEASTTMPSYRLSGPQLRLGFFLPLAQTVPIALGVVPEFGIVSSVSEEVAQVGSLSAGFIAGFEVQIRYDLIPELALGLVYRESHAVIGSDHEGDMSDVERFGVVRLTYRP